MHGQWTYSDSRNKVINNFTRQFKRLHQGTGVEPKEFHDLRRTALTSMLNNGLDKHDLMAIAGHSRFETTERFYLAVKDDLVDRAREAVDKASLLQICCSGAPRGSNEKGQQT